ncbi:MAG: DUF2269 domain-containing protein [Acidimicrobiia bacterium]|nr:DUF2269 domain-containing protein [Acidimicrobiia bacterium]
MTPGLRKLALTTHVASSVGWLGSVTAFLALSIVGLVSDDDQTVRAVYVAMDVSGWYVLVPFSVASLATGLVQSLGTSWGLLRHYWVVIKLVMTVVASVVLVLYTETLDHFACVAADTGAPRASLDGLDGASPVIHAAAALLLLLVATTLSVFKPRGLTRHGRRKQHQQRALSRS